MTNHPIMRVARPTDHLPEIKAMYIEGLGLSVLGEFADHDGFDGVILGHPNAPYHIEFTSNAKHAAGTAPSRDHLLVFYLPDRPEWEYRCGQMRSAGFAEVESFNPYWDKNGKTFKDLDGYRVVLQNTEWVV